MREIKLPLDSYELKILFRLTTAEMDKAVVNISKHRRDGDREALDKAKDDYAVLKFLWTKLAIEINREA
ncbi:TPA: hypothetical protein KOX39_003387 [Clostridioides difficile]|nr:hypothetical protein [Clostridioides difficile]